MVLESLIKPEWVAKQPLYALYLGVTLSFIGTSIGLFVFPEQASFAGLLFITIAAVPFLQKVIDFETKKGKLANSIWQRNKKTATIFALYFLGTTITYYVWCRVLPTASMTFFFSRQISALTQPTILGFFTQYQIGQYLPILINNLKVLFLVMLLSLIYGMGAILIITWNASVLGVFMATSFGKLSEFIAFIPHTGMEFIGFFFAAISGALISMSFDESRTKFKSPKFYQAINDASVLFLIGVVIIALAALIEIRLF